MGEISKSTKQALEVLEAIGQENEHEGIKATKYFVDQFDKREWNRQQIQEGKLDKERRFTKKRYFLMIAKMMNEEAQDLDIPPMFKVWANPTDKGVILFIKDPFTRTYRAAFTPCGQPRKDYVAVVEFLTRAQNTMDKVASEPSPSGLYLK